MAYVFDPINNTLIDDEDKSLGNKLALNDDEFQKLLDIPGVFRASEAPQPPERPDVQEIDAINRFMRDNPVEKAEGGNIGGGAISGEDYGDRTGFANVFLEQGKKSRFSPNSDTVVINGKEYLPNYHGYRRFW